jgi:transcriptional regulator with XRE-family HTH domain
MLQATLAKTLRISGAAVSKLESSKSKAPAASTLLKIAAAFEANPEWIMHGKGHPYEVQAEASSTEMASIFDKLSPQHQAAILAAAKSLL